MLAHVVAAMRPQVRRLVLNANGDAARFETFDLEVVADAATEALGVPAAGGLGPLAGLHAAMAWAIEADPAATAIATVSSDCPLLPLDLVGRLADAISARPGLPAIAVSADQRHPTIALWPLTLSHDLGETLRQGALSADRFARRHGAIEVSFPMRNIGGEDVDPFFNVNTPEDLERARKLFANK